MDTLGKYQIREVLGKGGMAVVYKAHDPIIGREVAIKTVPKRSVDPDVAEQVMARFKNEARAAGRLMHPNIVAIYEYGEDADQAYIVMEFVEGQGLRDLLDRRVVFDTGQVVTVMTQLLDALAFAHEKNVVHRDIKPANLILTATGHLKVADFGIARIDTSTLTMVGTVIGTPSYMSPEQFQGLEVDLRSDLFSAGVVLYELLAGVKPFTGSLETIGHKICTESPLPPSRVAEGRVPPAFDDVVARALEKRPESRFQDAAEFGQALRRAGESSAVHFEATLAMPELARASAETAVPVPATTTIDDPALRTIERELARFVGPVAKVMVRRAVTRTTNLTELCALLAESIATPAERSGFVEATRRIDGALTSPRAAAHTAAPSMPGATALQPVRTPPDAKFVDDTTARLAVYLGPIARIVTKRAAAQAGSVREFVDIVAGQVAETDRARFLQDIGFGGT